MKELAQLTGRERVRQKLRSAILSGELQPGQKLLPTEAISKRYGVSPRTAHEAMRDLVEEQLIVREKGRGTFVGRIPAVKAESAGVVALMLRPEGHVWADLVGQLVRDLQGDGYRTELIDASKLLDGLEVEESVLTAVLALSPAAILCQHIEAARQLCEAAPAANVICLRSEDDLAYTGSIVAPDTYLSAYLGTRHLAEQGARRIGWCSNQLLSSRPGTQNESDLALAGFRRALAETGCTEGQLIFASPLGDIPRPFAGILRPDDLPDAFFCTTDYRAAQIVDALREMGKRVPDDVAIVGTHNTPWAHAYQLTSINSHWDLVAEECGHLIRHRADGPARVRRRSFVQPELVLRQSSRRSTPRTVDTRQ